MVLLAQYERFEYSKGLKICHIGRGSWQRKIRTGNIALAFFALLFILSIGCSNSKNRDAQIKAALNQQLKQDAVSLRVNIGRVGWKCGVVPGLAEGDDLASEPRYRAAQKAKLISVTPDDPGFWKVELVNPSPQMVQSLKDFHHNVQEGCDSFMLGFVIASKSVADLVNVRKVASGNTEAEFTWKWTLSPHFGASLVDNLSEKERAEIVPYLSQSRPQADFKFNLMDIPGSTVTHTGTKMLKESGNGWVVDE